ncbi:catechol 1,2-dioxygenase [Povalibacter uvarum]|uniref:Catechol 1,2-dioxygenase n=1 Tax=Povalibacter uvarum TaxID=732238 RepID=A0A841HT23_9GAMM|nr:dioxygenase [Povalibacter uvarum]MBB6096487.1 catechol 1,2-dioxygenase [Povalibacter uvarum]
MTSHSPASRALNDALLQEVIASYARTEDARWNTVAESLLRHLHAFVNETGLTPPEWFAAIDFLTRTGKTCVGPRQEFILLSDALGISSAVDNIHNASSPGATESAVTGPFYAPGSPDVEHGASIALAGEGERVLITGSVRSVDGEPIAGAILDIWHTAPNQLYAVQDSTQPEMNFRGRLRSRGDGTFAFTTLKPTFYPVPVDGPVGSLLTLAGRHPMRPAHIHFTVTAPGFRSLTTQMYTRGDPYIDSDAVFGVKPSLLVDYIPVSDAASDLRWTLDHEFVLDREDGA